MFKSGQLVLTRYALAAPIGSGSMAHVWQAEDLVLKRQVAIKLLAVEGAEDRRPAIGRFLREARITASIQHRNVIHISDFGITEEDQPFMVMELLEGETLRERLSRPPALTEEVVLHIVSLILRGLTAVHEAGVIHRDLKPENIFLPSSAGGAFPKIIDFGVALSVDPNSELESVIEHRPGLVVGTPGYMPPEQLRGQADIDVRCDLYSVGAILYEALAGTCPDDRSDLEPFDLEAALQRIESIEPPPLRELVPTIHPLLSAFVARAMAKDRDKRFASARSMRAELLNAANALWPEQAIRIGSLPPSKLGRSPESLMAPPAPSEVALETGLLLNSSTPAAAAPSSAHAATPQAAATLGRGTEPSSRATARSRRWLALPVGVAFVLGAGLIWTWDGSWGPASEALHPAPASLPPVIVRADPAHENPTIAEDWPPLDRSLWEPAYVQPEDAGVDDDLAR